VQKARAAAAKAGLKVIISPRASVYGASLIAAGLTADEAADATYLNGLNDAQRKQIEVL
jgi:hypothetical protein